MKCQQHLVRMFPLKLRNISSYLLQRSLSLPCKVGDFWTFLKAFWSYLLLHANLTQRSHKQTLKYHYQTQVDSKNIIILLERIKNYRLWNILLCVFFLQGISTKHSVTVFPIGCFDLLLLWSQARGGLYLLTKVIFWELLRSLLIDTTTWSHLVPIAVI